METNMKDDSVTFTIRLEFDETGKPGIWFDLPAPQRQQTRQEWCQKNLPPTILFTGFKSADRARLEVLAIEKQMIVRKTVSGGLTFVVGGYNAGPAKMEMAKQEGATILTEEQFLVLISTGEVPSQMTV
jgi:NAD-dependent DNA ligase